MVARKLGLPVWASILLISVASYTVFVGTYVAGGLSPSLILIALYGLLIYFPLILGSLAASVYVRNKMVTLEAHAISMVEDPTAAGESLAPLSKTSPIAILAVGIFAIFVLPYLMDPSFVTSIRTLSAAIVIQIPWLLAVWTMSTALWVLGYSTIGVYRIGKLPMKLKPFTMDRTLGLKPFAATCLRLTAIYYGLVLFTIVTDLESPIPPVYMAIRTLGFIALGLAFFFLPLVNLHAKLVHAKAERLAWINGRYSRTMEKVEAAADGPLDADIQRDLLAIDKIQRDIQSIRTWPVDTSSLARLLTILLSVTAILVSRMLASVFGI